MIKNKWKDWICVRIVNQLPKRLIYWAAMKVVTYATTGEYSEQVVPYLTAMNALGRWDMYET